MEDAESLRALCTLPPPVDLSLPPEEIAAVVKQANLVQVRYALLSMLDAEEYPWDPHNARVEAWIAPVHEHMNRVKGTLTSEQRAELQRRSHVNDEERVRVGGEVAALAAPRWDGRRLRVVAWDYADFTVHVVTAYRVDGHRYPSDKGIYWASDRATHSWGSIAPRRTPEAAVMDSVRYFYDQTKQAMEGLVPAKDRAAGRTATPAREAPYVVALNAWARAAELLGEPIEGHVYRQPEWDNRRAPAPTGDAATAKALIAEARRRMPKALALSALHELGLAAFPAAENEWLEGWWARVRQLPDQHQRAVEDALRGLPPESLAPWCEPYVGQRHVRTDGYGQYQATLVTPLGPIACRVGGAHPLAQIALPVRHGYVAASGDRPHEAEAAAWRYAATVLTRAIRPSWSAAKRAAYERTAEVMAREGAE